MKSFTHAQKTQIATLLLFNIRLAEGLVKAQTVAFTTLVMLEIMRVYLIRSQYKIGLFSNKYLLLAIASSILLQLVVIYTPLGQFFGTTFLNLLDWVYIMLAVLTSLVISIVFNKIIKKVTKQVD